MVPMEGVEPTHPYGYQILSLARLPIPPHRLPDGRESGLGDGYRYTKLPDNRKHPIRWRWKRDGKITSVRTTRAWKKKGSSLVRNGVVIGEAIFWDSWILQLANPVVVS